MRGLILLLSVILAFLLILRFYPQAPGEGRQAGAPVEQGAAEAAKGLGEVQRPPDEGTVDLDASQGFLVRPEVVPAESAPAAPPRPAWLVDAEDPVESADWEAPVAAAIVHDTPDQLARALGDVGPGDLDDDHRRWVLAFGQALAGDRQRALQTAGEITEGGLSDAEGLLLRRALGGKGEAQVEAALRPESSIQLAMRLSLRAKEAATLLAEKRYAEAARAYSDVLLGELEAPWESDSQTLAAWTAGLDKAQANHRWNPRGEWAHEEVVVGDGDHLTGIRTRYVAAHPERIMSVGLIRRANGIQGFIHAGDKVRIPTDPATVLVDLGARWTLFLLGDEVADSWPVGIGRPGEETITGDFVAGEKEEKPVWWPAGEEPIPFGDPRNPLGSHWIEWYRGDQPTSYGFHGTNDPASVGFAASEGCLRLLNEDVEILFEILPIGAPIHVRA